MAAPIAFDLLVIGGGSGGLASARRAAQLYKKRVALVESAPWLGGTCVNVGCVPKKVMFNAATLRESLAMYARDHHVSASGEGDTMAPVDFGALKSARDAYVRRLNGIYASNVAKAGVVHVHGTASFVDDRHVCVTEAGTGATTVYTAPHILIATGGRPTMLSSVAGIELALSSDGFFDLEALPRKVAVIGSGYIGVELAGILRALGSDVHLFMRHDKPLRYFDPMLQQAVLDSLTAAGVTVHKETQVSSLTMRGHDTSGSINALDLHRQLTSKSTVNSNSISVHAYHSNNKDKDKDNDNKSTDTLLIDDVSTVICATGRSPNTAPLCLHNTSVRVKADSGEILTDYFQNTTAQGVYAVGDVCGPIALTPVAIAAGRRLVDRLFGGPEMSERRLDYSNVPSVVFSHPPCGAVGLTEPEARRIHGDKIKCYQSRFNNLFYALSDPAHKTPTIYKLVVVGPEERVVGVHLFGLASDEVLQGFAVAVKMGATKRDFDDTVAIHPTAAEELVTMT